MSLRKIRRRPCCLVNPDMPVLKLQYVPWAKITAARDACVFLNVLDFIACARKGEGAPDSVPFGERP